MRHPTAILSETVGVPEPALRLLLTILLAYPVAGGYRYLYSHSALDKTKETIAKAVESRNRYIMVSGIALATLFNGWAIYHSLVTLVVSYSLCAVFSTRRTWAVASVWTFNATYLLTGYYVMAAEEYDISWTMTQCILCLRLMGFSMDFMDGNEPNSDKASNQLRPLSFGPNTALPTLPALSHVAAYCFYPSAFLVGPQFSFSLYQDWLVFDPSTRCMKKQQYHYVLKCVAWAVAYLALQQLVGSHYPTSYLLTREYAALPFLRRLGIFWLAGKFVFTKYLGIWLLTEGATALFGIGYEGQDKEGRHLFAGLANVDPFKYETATSIQDIINSFNINTNLWSKYYVFKRLRWMGSKTASQTGTLVFLAIWHGFHYGYFVTFLMEFLDLKAEGILRQWVYLKGNSKGGWISRVLAWCLCSSTLFYAGVGFDLLSLTSSWIAYRQVYFIGHLALAGLLWSAYYLPAPPPVKLARD